MADDTEEWTSFRTRYATVRVPPLRSVVTAAGPVSVRDSGPRPAGELPVVALHGWCADSLSNHGLLFESLSGTRRVVAPDLPGHGGTATAARFSLEHCADVVDALCDTLGFDQVVAVGYSMGGPVSQLWARRNPGRVVALVQVATASQLVPSAPTSTLGAAVGVVASVGFDVTRPLWGLLRPFAGTSETGSLVQHARFLFTRSDKSALAAAMAELARFDSRSWVSSLGCPSVSVVTTSDRTVVPAAQLQLAELLGAQVSHVAAGHRFCFDGAYPAAVLDAVSSLSQLRGAPRHG